MPGRLLRDGVTSAGATNATLTPGDCGVTVIVNSVPPATGITVNPVSIAGAVPGGTPVVLNTNGSAKRGHGTLPGAVSVARYQFAGAPASRSSPGSCDATSYVAVVAPGSTNTRTSRRCGSL